VVFSKIQHNGEPNFVIANISVFRHESGGWEHIFVLWDGSVMFLEFLFYQIVVKVQLSRSASQCELLVLLEPCNLN
jgi:hypothetical protein